MAINIEDISTQNNVVEKEVLSLFKPFRMMHALFVTAKYKIKDDVISANTLLYTCMSGFTSIVILVFYFFSIFQTAFVFKWEGLNLAKQVCNIFIYAIYLMGSMMNFCSDIINKDFNVLLVYKIQSICETLKIKGKSLKNFIMINWIYVITLNVYHMWWIVFFSYAFSSSYLYYEVVTNYFYIIFDMNVLYGMRVMKIIRQPLQIWLEEVRNLNSVIDEDYEYFWNKMFKIYEETLETYQIFAKIFRSVVSKVNWRLLIILAYEICLKLILRNYLSCSLIRTSTIYFRCSL
ncbi:hypothetical protein B5X24_HaOG200722 [Helicoverpa armigera]|uniref:Gustatory receptor n=1 Tax=Helicoverpa armigera TaxID=29058 RepID=A0A2W1BPV3_HELAM|nr:hypothetical protein B5X24_HaOG200722 [Helicoverpa armigera]